MTDGLYLCASWQGFIQQIIQYISRGYYHYRFIRLPEKKRDRWTDIDKKLIALYDTGVSRDVRYRRKKAGKANHIYLRYADMAVILKTDGDQQELFRDIKEHPLEIRISEEVELKLHSKVDNSGFTVHFTKNCYRNFKAKLLELLEKRQLDKVKYYFNALNGIPAYSGITEHKKLLLPAILKSAKKHGLSLKRTDFRLMTKLHKYKVFER